MEKNIAFSEIFITPMGNHRELCIPTSINTISEEKSLVIEALRREDDD